MKYSFGSFFGHFNRYTSLQIPNSFGYNPDYESGLRDGNKAYFVFISRNH